MKEALDLSALRMGMPVLMPLQAVPPLGPFPTAFIQVCGPTGDKPNKVVRLAKAETIVNFSKQNS